jgi:glycosyltransferase involved in cell wall biosynthesis
MKIVVNALPLLTPLTGAGYYTFQICNHLRQMDTIHTYRYFYGYYSQSLRSPEKTSSLLYHTKEAFRHVPILGTALKNLRGALANFPRPDFDLYFEPHFIPLDIKSRRRVVTVLDFSFARFPQWHPQDKVQYFQRHFWEKIKKADRIICISDFIRKEAIQEFGFPPEKVKTVSLGVDPKFFRIFSPGERLFAHPRHNLPEKFILFVGSLEPRKNLSGLLHAYRRLKPLWRKEFKLVFAGLQGWENKAIWEQIQQLREDVLYLGYVPISDLGKLYNRASLFVYPSFYEGFGLPPLEAMACGCPVVVSQEASLPEVCGEAAHYVNPHEVDSIAAGIEKVLDDEAYRQGLVTKGLGRGGQFTWEKSAREHLRVFEEAMDG